MNVNFIYVEVCSTCNLNCSMCYNDSGQTINNLDYDILIKSLDIAIKFNPSNIVISGGEPSLYPYITQLLEYLCNEKKCTNVVLVTNGTTYKGYDIINRYHNKLQTVQFSLDGHTPEIHDYIRGKGAYDKLTTNWDKLIENSLHSNIAVNTVINNINKNYLYEIIQLCIDKKAKGIKFELILPQGRAMNNRELLLNNSDVFETIKKLKEYKLKFNGIIDIVLPDVKSGCPFTQGINNQTFPRIDYMGNVYPCSGLTNRSHIIGNIYDNNLSDILEERNIDMFIKRISSLNKKCDNCTCKTICRGGCLMYCSDNTSPNFDIMCGIRKTNLIKKMGIV